MLPGIVKACYAMPDAHWGYGFPIGGVAAFDPDEGGVVSAGGVGFDISCGVRSLRTGLKRHHIEAVKTELADTLYHTIPAGVGSTGRIHLNTKEMDSMLKEGAQWALKRGYGRDEDLERTEEHGCMVGADPEQVKKLKMALAKGAQPEMCQVSMKIYDKPLAALLDGFIPTKHPVAVKRIADLQEAGYLYIKP